MRSRLEILLFLILTFYASEELFAQEFGFGCFGLVGGYAGYETQIVHADGLNNYINAFNTMRADSMESPLSLFDELKGFRFGLDVYRLKYVGFAVKFKSYYQRLSAKKQTLVTLSQGVRQNNSLEFVMNNFAIGADVTTPITRMITWKILDVGMILNTASFIKTINTSTTTFESKDYKSVETSLGYSIGTGFILNIIEDYISLEGTAAYSFFSVRRLRSGSFEYLTVTETNPAIMDIGVNNGGLNTLIQFNIGLPF